MTNQPPHPVDDEFARVLEKRHEQILRGEQELFRSGDERVDSAVEMLELLGDYRDVHQQSIELRETSNVGTRSTPGNSVVPEVAIYELESLGRFRILEPIGRGGFGVVFRAFDPELEREVAIKVSRWDLAASRETQQRFQREAIAAAGLNHPGILRVYEADSDRGLDFIVSELVDGQNLAGLLANGRRFSVNESVKIIVDLTDALEHAHQRGVLHRDLKPANVLVPESEDQERLRPIISDFGLAAIQGHTDLTLTGAMVGTPEHMSPEQAAGNNELFGPQTDVYALGGILYNLLTGRSPFAGNNLLNTLEAIKRTDASPPSNWNPEVPQDLDAVCLKCLEKRPEKRYASARDLQADLNRYLQGVPVVARRITDIERGLRWTRRNPFASGLSIALLLGLLVGLVTVGYLWRVSEANFRKAELNHQKFVGKSEQMTSAVDRLFVSLANHPEIQQASADGLRRTLLEEAHRFQETFLQESPEDPNLQLEFARSMKRLGDIYSHLGDYAASLDLVREAIEIVQEQDPLQINNHELVDWWNDQAEAETHMGQFRRANQSFQTAMKLMQDRNLGNEFERPSRQLRTAQIQINHARSFVRQNKIKEAEDEALKAELALLAIEPSVDDHQHQHLETLLWNRGTCRYVLAEASRLKGKYERAAAYCSEAIKDFDTVFEFSPNSNGLNYDRASCLQTLGLCWAEQKRPEKAEGFYRQAIALLDELLQQHPKVEIFRSLHSSVEYSLAANRMVVGDFPEFHRLIDANIDAKRKLVEDFPDAPAMYYSQLGDAMNLRYFGLSREGKSKGHELIAILLEAQLAFEQSMRVLPEWNQPKMAVAKVKSNMAIEYAKQNRMDKAIAHFEEAIDLLRPMVRDQPHWIQVADQYFSSTVSLVYVLQKTNKLDEAIKAAQAVVEDCSKHPRAFSIRLGIPKLLAEAGRHDEMHEYLNDLSSHARSWKDFGNAASTALKLSETVQSDLPILTATAVRILHEGLESQPQSRNDLLEWVRTNPGLDKLPIQRE